VGVAVNQTATTAYQLGTTVPCGAHWVRLRYTATTSSSGLTASVYWNGVRAS
jgi:hypothetical protein